MIKELQLLAATLAPAYSALVCRGTPVKNPWCKEQKKNFDYFIISLMRDLVRSLNASEPQFSSMLSIGTELKTIEVITLKDLKSHDKDPL